MNKTLSTTLSIALIFSLGSSSVSANHSWGKYHWNLSTEDTIASPLKLGDNVSAIWESSLVGASSDWNESVLKNQVVAGTSDAGCSPTSGQVEICNGEYGNNGWLGIAQIWATRGRSSHIVQGAVLLNDSYFNQAQYNTSAWRNMVTCQEIGHTFGLSHQDENFSNSNLGTCMDYTSDPDGTLLSQLNNEHPNDHDYEEMASIYGHLNSTGTDDGPGGNGGGKGKKPKKVGVDSRINLDDPSSWGRAIRQDAQGNNSLFEKDLGNGTVLITHVTWAE